MRILKQALQPSIDNVSIDWKVPSADVSQVPTELPPVFSGSRLVVFGIPRHESKNKSQRTECEAVLSYQQGEEERSLSVHFTLPPSKNRQLGDEVDAYPVHRLAGKQLLQEVAKENNKPKLVRVSLETGVVCKDTAFVAVAEDGEEAVTGALERQTISVPTRHRQKMRHIRGGASHQAFQSQFISSANVSVARDRGARLAELEAKADLLQTEAKRFKKCSSSLNKGGFASGVGSALSAAGSWVSSLFSSKSAAVQTALMDESAPPPPRPHRQASNSASIAESLESSEDEFQPEAIAGPCMESFSNQEQKQHKSPASGSGHLSIIALQQFSGAWDLNEALAKICGRSLTDLRSSLPASLSSSSDKESIWATLLAVALLKHRHGDAEDEWELVVEKAILWVRSCVVSTSDSVDELLKIAKSSL